MEQQSTPYRDAAPIYRAAGWRGVLPIPYRTKKMNASGWTGHAGRWPSGPDIQAWCDSDLSDEGRGNIALRLPPDVIGIDVDNYGDKHGAEDLKAAVARWGPLPDTWSSTARSDGISRIRLFRVPEGLRWPGQVGPSIEIIQTTHRYAVVWPSVHPEGSVYRWYRPDGLASTAPPRVDELPDLPDAWVLGLTGGEMAEDVVFADMGTGEVGHWIVAHSRGERPCGAMRTTADRLLAEMRTGSAHESLRRLMGLIRHAEKGHTGLAVVLGEVNTAFVAEATDPARGGSTRDLTEARGEWMRSLHGAVRRIVGNPTMVDADTAPGDPCDNPFAGLVAAAPPPSPIVAPSPAAAAQPTPGAAQVLDVANAFLMADPIDEPEGGQVDSGGVVSAPLSESAERTTWWHVDLAEIVSGEYSEPQPVVLERSDGQALFYAGKINGLLGESESGKSWILLAAAAQQLDQGRAVLYLDFEDTAAAVVARLLAFGVKPSTIVELFHYVAPDESMHAIAAGDFAQQYTLADYGLIGLDGVNAAMTLLGLDLSSNTDATRFSQQLLKPLARTGAAVVTVDHVGKDKETRGKGGIGAQAKRAMVTGCSLSVDVLAPFGRGQTGKLKLTVDKDRPGHVRGFAENSKNAGIATLESGSNGSVRVRIDPPGSAPAAVERQPFRPTAMMERISRLLSTTDGDLSGKQIEESIEGRSVTIRQALDRLVEEGFVSRHSGARNAVRHRYERTYREMSELAGADMGDGPDEY